MFDIMEILYTQAVFCVPFLSYTQLQHHFQNHLMASTAITAVGWNKDGTVNWSLKSNGEYRSDDVSTAVTQSLLGVKRCLSFIITCTFCILRSTYCLSQADTFCILGTCVMKFHFNIIVPNLSAYAFR